jgi:hypothetical protein
MSIIQKGKKILAQRNSLGLEPFVERLASLFLREGGCPYGEGGKASPEPTILSLLALFAAGPHEDKANSLIPWILKYQTENGSIGINLMDYGWGLWLTAYFAVFCHHYTLSDRLENAMKFLQSFKSVTLMRDPKAKQDDSIVGWPWVPGTFGWVEPTAWAVIAFNVCGMEQNPRALEGRRFLLDRCISSGGWNYGNTELNDRELLPFWDTTALALLALQGTSEEKRLSLSLELLEKNQDKINSLLGMAWTFLALKVYGRDTGRLRSKLISVMQTLNDDDFNAAHYAIGIIALSGKRVLTP